ncbi:MAG: uridine kinase [Propionibacteriaceae bacterium]|jgi:uridine kinase|nr:uridine kinase [Propionibacteriaceae bacterium]
MKRSACLEGGQVFLLAGPSGSGKSRLALRSGHFILRLDDFYLDEDAPDMPRAPGGFIDWDDPRTWDAETAADALAELVRIGRVNVPAYDISVSRAVGRRELVLPAPGTPVIAEGVFATELLGPCLARGLAVTPIWVDRSRVGNWWRRFRRDVTKHRKPIPLLLRRGLQLAEREPGFRAAALRRGFVPLSYAKTEDVLQGRTVIIQATRAPDGAPDTPVGASTRLAP